MDISELPFYVAILLVLTFLAVFVLAKGLTGGPPLFTSGEETRTVPLQPVHSDLYSWSRERGHGLISR
jgi:hypothetical protein